MTLQKYLTNYQEQVVLPTPSKNKVKEINFHEMNFCVDLVLGVQVWLHFT